MLYSTEVKNMCPVKKGAYHGPAPIPEEGKWVQVKEIKDISGLTHGVGWCAPQQGACKLTLNVKDGIIEESPRRNPRLLRHDPFGSDGFGNPAGQDAPRSAEYRLGMRRYQRSYAPALPADRIRPHADGLLRRRPSHRRQLGRPGQGPAQPGRHDARHERARAIWK